ncbi:hypothetical protein L2E82_19852 [Cichorium intybus]|uniref:Uncharacterized protein n=1 Tax=Cichorium intybus TaxID=13427 RepID=A0ACB9DS45_CICIN|nr:hypothetical protein L2E82_19852 [Cichorium intybus]
MAKKRYQWEEIRGLWVMGEEEAAYGLFNEDKPRKHCGAQHTRYFIGCLAAYMLGISQGFKSEVITLLFFSTQQRF